MRLRSALLATVLLILAGCVTSPPEPYQPAAVADAEHTTIALLGATGMTGGYLLDEALARGYQVRALARSPDKLSGYGDRVTVIGGDARNPEALRALIRGADIVVSALGPAGPSGAGINSSVTGLLIPLLHSAGIARYVVLSGAGVDVDGDRRGVYGLLLRWGAQLRYPALLADRQREYQLLASSELQWTLWRCPLIKPTPTAGRPLVAASNPPALQVRAGDLADLLFDAFASQRFLRQAPFPGSK